MSSILSIAPYKFLPPVNGGHWGIIIVEKILSVFNEVHTVSTKDNILKRSFPFKIHFILSKSKLRYLPFSQYFKVLKLAREIRPDYIFCHHPYMFPMAGRVARKLKIPVYTRCHNIEAERFRSTGKWWWKLMYSFEQSTFRQSDGVFFVTMEDRMWAMEHYKLDAAKAIVFPFGIDFDHIPEPGQQSKKDVALQYGLNPDVPWLFFMGQLDYGPNEDAVKHIIYDVFPLLKKSIKEFHFLICGKNLAPYLEHEIVRVAANKELVYLGFVPEIEPILFSCDVMVNPVISGGGVKTKVVESLAWNKTVVSAFTGAIGIESSMCGNKLLVAPDKDWDSMVTLIQQALKISSESIPTRFFDYYSSKSIAQRMQQYFEG